MAIFYKKQTLSQAAPISEPIFNIPLKSAVTTYLIDREKALTAVSGEDKESLCISLRIIDEAAEDFAVKAGADPMPFKAAALKAAVSTIFAGRGMTIQVELSAFFAAKELAWVQCSVKHYMSTTAFLPNHDEKDSAARALIKDAGLTPDQTDFDSMLDEIRYIHGIEKTSGRKEFFRKKSIRMYTVPRQKKILRSMSEDFIKYIETLSDYTSALFVRIDHISMIKEIIISKEKGSIESIKKIMSMHGYELQGSENYRDASFSFWSAPLSTSEYNQFDSIVGELEQLISAKTEGR